MEFPGWKTYSNEIVTYSWLYYSCQGQVRNTCDIYVCAPTERGKSGISKTIWSLGKFQFRCSINLVSLKCDEVLRTIELSCHSFQKAVLRNAAPIRNRQRWEILETFSHTSWLLLTHFLLYNSWVILEGKPRLDKKDDFEEISMLNNIQRQFLQVNSFLEVVFNNSHFLIFSIQARIE